MDGLYFSTQVNGAVCFCRKRLAELRQKICTFGEGERRGLEFRDYLIEAISKPFSLICLAIFESSKLALLKL